MTKEAEVREKKQAPWKLDGVWPAVLNPTERLNKTKHKGAIGFHIMDLIANLDKGHFNHAMRRSQNGVTFSDLFFEKPVMHGLLPYINGIQLE